MPDLSYDTASHIYTSYGQCWSCGEATSWVEINFETHICPGACTANIWVMYQAALAPSQEPGEVLLPGPQHF